MKNTERIRLLYQNDCAFNMGIIVGKKEMIEKACQWLFENVYDYLNPEDQERVESFKKAMGEWYASTE